MRKLGKKEARVVPGALKLSKYVATLPDIPGSIGWATAFSDWQMLGNDSIGDCTCACAGHIIMEEEVQNGRPYTNVTQDGVIKAYSAVSGYVPGDESTDNGAYIHDVLSYWKKTGICGNKIAGYVSVNVSSLEEIKAAIYIFGALDIGIQLPGTAQTQIDNGEPWTLTEGYQNDPNAAPGSWGGHSIPLVGYRKIWPTGSRSQEHHLRFRGVTWGAFQMISVPWLSYYMDEAWAVLDLSWLSPEKVAPNGLDLAQLQADLTAL